MSKASVQRALLALGLRVAELRDRAGLTQDELAEATGLSLRYVQLIEAASASPSFGTLLALAEGLRVPIRALFEPAARSLRRRRGRPRKAP